MSVGVEGRPSDSKVVFYNDPRIRSLFFQLLLLAAIVALFWFAYDNTVTNLKKRNIAQGFAFWCEPKRVCERRTVRRRPYDSNVWGLSRCAGDGPCGRLSPPWALFAWQEASRR